jgi:plasmid stabilization system protein ParE
MASGPQRIVRYSAQAATDLAENYSYTAHFWGLPQADRYREMLLEAAEQAAQKPYESKGIKGFPELRYIFAKWPKARYGHNIIFLPEQEGIYVLRVLHTSMDMPSNLT